MIPHIKYCSLFSEKCILAMSNHFYGARGSNAAVLGIH